MVRNGAWYGTERRQQRTSDDDIERIAKRVDELRKIGNTLAVGRIAERFIYTVVGALIIAAFAWLAAYGKINFP